MESHYKNGAFAVTKGIKNATDGLKFAMRSQVRSAGLSSRLANTWRGDSYPKSKSSIKAAGVVYTNAQKIMEGFEYETIIRSTTGTWLAIPTEAVKKRIKPRSSKVEINACTTNINGDFCLIYEPVYMDYEKDTFETIRQVDRNNIVYDDLCN